jgi:hypothetical protein
MKKIILMLAYILFCVLPARAGFTNYTYVANTGVGSVSSITSPALTMSGGDFVLVMCASTAATTGDPASSTPSNTFNTLTFQADSGDYQVQLSYATNMASGSTTFTCTPNVSSAFQSMIVLHYAPSTVTMTSPVDVQSGGYNNGTVSTFTVPPSGSITTTNAKDTIILCGGGTITAGAFTAGSIGGTGATLRGVDGATLGTSSKFGCEDLAVTTTQSMITGSISNANTGNWTGTIAAFKAPSALMAGCDMSNTCN